MMKTIRIITPCGDYKVGDIVEIIQRRADGLIQAGYAVAAEANEPRTANDPSKEAAMTQHAPGQRGRRARGREAR